ncbi:MAG TPA: hypothetical protein VMA72_21110 [Streptosporangiaceae bacterium]|nr:hypothetical protein [Streptosporangiaceae bacterium]
MRKPLWARPACDPDLPAELRLLIAHGRQGAEAPADCKPRSSALRRWRQQRDLDRQSDKIIFPHDLHGTDRLLLARAQNAVDTILGSRVRAAGLLEPDEPALRRHEWEIACTSRELTRVRELPAADVAAGALTAAVVDAQQRALALAEESTINRIRALERYAGQVAAADDAHRDWEAALGQGGLNDIYLDLVARTAADELAVAELGELTERAATTADVLKSSLRDAFTTGAALSLPVPRAG